MCFYPFIWLENSIKNFHTQKVKHKPVAPFNTSIMSDDSAADVEKKNRVIALVVYSAGVGPAATQIIAVGAACQDFSSSSSGAVLTQTAQWAIKGPKKPTRDMKDEMDYGDFDKSIWNTVWKDNYLLLGWSESDSRSLSVTSNTIRGQLDEWLVGRVNSDSDEDEAEYEEFASYSIVLQNASDEGGRMNHALTSYGHPMSSLDYIYGDGEESDRDVFKPVRDLGHLRDLVKAGILYKPTEAAAIDPKTDLPGKTAAKVALEYGAIASANNFPDIAW
jgi:hypothetical protein